MRGPFIVEGKPVRLMADAGDPAGMLVPAFVLRAGCRWSPVPHGRAQWVLEQAVLDVGKQQFLVLLFVADTQFDQRREFLACEQRRHRRVDMRTPCADFVERGAREHPAGKSRDPFALRFVIGIEDERPVLVIEPIPVEPIAQKEGFPEPGGVREMPLGGASILHRLDRRVGIRQGRDQRFGERAGRCIAGLDFLSKRGLRLWPDLVQRRSP